MFFLIVIASLSFVLAADQEEGPIISVPLPDKPTDKYNPKWNGLLEEDGSDEPPYYSSIWITDLITDSDISTFESESTIYLGQECRFLFDRRTASILKYENQAYIFVVTFSDNIKIEFQVHSEFESSNNAKTFVDHYAFYIGRLPAFLRDGVKTVMLLKGNERWGGGVIRNYILIHTDYYAGYDPFVEEILFHEAAHAVVDPPTPAWVLAQERDDGAFISEYGKNHRLREDIAESLLAWFSFTHLNSRLSEEDSNIISTTIPNRLDFFDRKNFDDVYPFSGEEGGYDGGRYGSGQCTAFAKVVNNFCFAPDAKVIVLGKGKVSMKDLVAGDNVLTASEKYKTIFTIDHFHSSMPTLFLQIQTTLDENALELTPSHLIFIEGIPYPVPASDVQIGDEVKTVKGPAEVTKIQTVNRNGFYNPITTDGTIVVDGIFASTYTSMSGTSHLEIRGAKLVSFQFLMDMTIAPYRAFCMGTSLYLCIQHGELASTSKAMQRFYLTWSQQDDFIKFLIFLIHVLCFGPISLVVKCCAKMCMLALLGISGLLAS